MVFNRRQFLWSSLASSLAAGLPVSVEQASADTMQSQDEGFSLALQQKLAKDPLRPQFHLLPRHNWMNDPCAPRFHRGEYHMFFQYNPHAAVWGDMHWNHATSPDMVHWKHLPLALAPTRTSYDAYGCFTGSVLPGMAQPTILYTGVTKTPPEQETIRGEGTREVQCFATSDDPDLRTWQKLDKPVIEGPPSGVKVTGFRDPCPWKEGDTWYLIVGSGFDKVGGCVLLYTSQDGRSWTYHHPLAQGVWNSGSQTNPVDTGEMWECPDFFPLGDKHVLLYSTERKVYWEVGTFDRKELRFHSETKGMLDHGVYYAMKSMEDAQGRRVLWGWAQETRSPEACIAAGWSGCMALPRVLTLGADNRLRMAVPPEFVSLRRKEPGPARHGSVPKLNSPGRALEVEFRFRPGKIESGLELRAGDTSALSLTHHQDGGQPVLSIQNAGVETKLNLSPDADGLSTVGLWVDGSVIEIFADDREAATLRNYLPGAIAVVQTGAPSATEVLNFHEVAPISPDRLTS